MTFFQTLWIEFERLIDWAGLEEGPLLILDVAVVAALFYWLYRLIRGTRATRILAGLLVVGGLWFVASRADLQLLSSVMSKTFTVLLVALPVIFQPELRRALGKIGETGRLIRGGGSPSFSTVTEIVRACEDMASERVGALILIKRQTGLETVIESGTVLDARASSRLLRSIFAPYSELHDGAVVIEDDRIIAAGCFYVSGLSEPQVFKWGARHRAAVGLSLETDALVISISQERGTISLAHDGKLVEDVSAEELEETLVRLGTAKPLPARRQKRKKSRALVQR